MVRNSEKTVEEAQIKEIQEIIRSYWESGSFILDFARWVSWKGFGIGNLGKKNSVNKGMEFGI